MPRNISPPCQSPKTLYGWPGDAAELGGRTGYCGYQNSATMASVARRYSDTISLRSRGTEARRDVLDGCALGGADAFPALPVSVGHLVRQGEDEAPEVLEFLRRRLALKKGDRTTEVLE